MLWRYLMLSKQRPNGWNQLVRDHHDRKILILKCRFILSDRLIFCLILVVGYQSANSLLIPPRGKDILRHTIVSFAFVADTRLTVYLSTHTQ
jgi:hypothetical protein